MLALVGAGCFLVAQVAVWAYIARIGIARGLTEQFVGAAVGLSTIAATGAALGAAWIAGRTSRFRVMAICIPLQVLLMAMLLVSSSTVAYILFVFGFNMIWSLWVPFQMGLIAEVDTSGRFIVLTPFFQSLGIAIAPALVALFLTGRNYDPAMWIGIGFVLTSLILSLPLLRQENRERA